MLVFRLPKRCYRSSKGSQPRRAEWSHVRFHWIMQRLAQAYADASGKRTIMRHHQMYILFTPKRMQKKVPDSERRRLDAILPWDAKARFAL